MERIVIRNFGGISELDIELNRVNLFIGKQASGKSVTAKLIYFFKGICQNFIESAIEERTKIQNEKKLLAKFEEYFPSETWPIKNFELVYIINDQSIRIKKEKSKIKLEFSEGISKLFYYSKKLIKSDRDKFEPEDRFEIYRPNYKVRERYTSILAKELGGSAGYNPLFIPAGRSFFANLQSSIFSFLSNNNAIDPFLVEFGSFYENIKPLANRTFLRRENKVVRDMIEEITFDILGGRYHREKNKDFLIHSDKRKINVSFASSGQQETLPLVLILKALTRVNFFGDGSSVFIEEPEAHLFPAAQKRIIELMGLVFNSASSDLQLIITTHSPYVLTSLNNLIQASIISKIDKSHEKSVHKIVSKELIIDSSFLNAYTFKDGTAESIIDDESGLIFSKYLDEVSEEIAIQFDHLLEI